MKIAVIGYGKMGRLISEIAKERKHEVVTIDSNASDADFDKISLDTLSNVDICIDFTSPSSVMENIERVISLKKNLIVGTTGWYDKLNYVEGLAKKNNIGFLYASNFSIGVNVFYQIVKKASSIINKIDSYDVCGIEYHHNQKADSPSGTAKTLANIILNEVDRKKTATFDVVDRKINEDELHFASVRCGAFPGTHEISFDSTADTISLKHTARNRCGFALGAVLCAEWLCDKKGFFTIDDYMKEIF